VTIGASAAVRVVLGPDAQAPPGLVRYRANRGRTVVGGSLSDGGNLVTWLARLLHADPDAVGDRDRGAHGPVLLPLLGGERSPGWRPDARGRARRLPRGRNGQRHIVHCS
jgi:gluconokinase